MPCSFFSPAQASDASHYAAAKRLFEATNSQDLSGLAKQVVSALLSNSSASMQKHRQIIEDEIVEICTSDDYRELKIRSYMNHLTEAELNELTRAFSSEAYRSFRSSQVEMLRESNEGILLMFQNRRAELQQKILAAEAADN